MKKENRSKTALATKIIESFESAVKDVVLITGKTELQKLSKTDQTLKDQDNELICSLCFKGDYNGTFSITVPVACMEEIASNMFKSFTEDNDIYAIDDLKDALGEIVNQTAGKARSIIQKKTNLVATNEQPKLYIKKSSHIDTKESSQEKATKLLYKSPKGRIITLAISVDDL